MRQRRNVWSAFVVAGFMAVTNAGCGEIQAAHDADKPAAVAVGPGSTVVIPSNVHPHDIVVVGVDGSISDMAQRPALVSMVVANVVPAAVQRKALLTASVVGSRGFNEGAAVGQIDFEKVTSDENVDPNAAVTDSTQGLVDKLNNVLSQTQSTASDPLGFLRRVAEIRASWPQARVLGVYVGDGGQSTEGCDLGVSSVVDDIALEQTAKACLDGRPIDLHDTELWFLGIGLSVNSGGMTEAQALDAGRFLTYVGQQAHATVAPVAASPIAGQAQ